MPDVKLVLWNMEWLNDLFGKDDEDVCFKNDNEETQHKKKTTIKQRRDDLYAVINKLSPDLLVIIEGPSRNEELQLFFNEMKNGTWITYLQKSNGGQQNIGIAIRVDQNKFLKDEIIQFDTSLSMAFKDFLVDTDDDSIKEQYSFERLPLYIEIKQSDGKKLRILGLHLKSKGIFDAYEWSKWWSVADGNRRKIIAEAIQIREKFLDVYFKENESKEIPLIVCGDFNDGPGFDASEKKIFGSGVEKIIGSIWKPDNCLGSVIFDALKEKEKEKLDFSKIYTTSYRDPIFNDTYQHDWIDHILYSKNMKKQWLLDGKINEYISSDTPIWKEYKHSSDHYPVSAIIRI